ncbi:hypothetical protein D3C80_704770 [compost metagenome]
MVNLCRVPRLLDLRHFIDYRLPFTHRDLKQLLVDIQQLLKIAAQNLFIQRSLAHDIFHAGTAIQVQLTDGLPVTLGQSTDQRFTSLLYPLQYKTHGDLP